MAREKTAIDIQRSKVESLLWDCFEQAGQAPAVTGHPSTSPTYRMMQAGMGRSGSRVTSPWRGRVRRYNDNQVMGGRLEIEPAGTCYGRETRSTRVAEFTQPEIDADRMGPPVEWVGQIIAAMPSYQRDVILLRYRDRVREFKTIAAEMRAQADTQGYPAGTCTKDAVATLHNAALDHIYRLMFEMAAPVRRSIIPEQMAVEG
ncbi:hypothetical protein [Salinisphaera sp. T31B1]|uniref:hypothetical protein n=1 Tax=Salinisphaera sp. T31B1 TaxID=727963 RepID=UPI0033403D63